MAAVRITSGPLRGVELETGVRSQPGWLRAVIRELRRRAAPRAPKPSATR